MALMMNGTWWTLEAHMVIRAAAAVDLLFIDAPEALVQTGMHHLPVSVAATQSLVRASMATGLAHTLSL